MWRAVGQERWVARQIHGKGAEEGILYEVEEPRKYFAARDLLLWTIRSRMRTEMRMRAAVSVGRGWVAGRHLEHGFQTGALWTGVMQGVWEVSLGNGLGLH